MALAQPQTASHPSRAASTDASPKTRGLMAILDACARHGKVCPGLAELSALLGLRIEKVRICFDSLRDAGIIRWEVPYCGTGLGKVRVVTILATGQTTVKPAYRKRGAGAPGKEAKSERNEIERAKTALRRFGRVVFNAEVSDGPSGKGMIKVDGRNMAPLDVLRLAQESGAL